MVVAVASRRFLFLRDLGDQRVGGEQEGRHARRVLQSGADHLRRVDHARTDEVAILALVSVVAVVLALHLPDAIHHDRAVGARVLGDGRQGIPQRVLDDRRPHLLVPFQVELLEGLFTAEQSHAAARDNALGEGRLHGALGVVDQGLPLLHLGLSGGTHVDLGHPASKLGEPLLQLLAVVVARGLRDLVANLGHPAVDGGLRAGTAHDRGVLSLHDHLLGSTKVAELHGIEGDAEILEDRLTAGQRGDVAQHGLASVAVAGSLHSHRLDDAAEFVDDQRGKRLALHVFGNQNERLARLADRLEQRHQILGARDLLFEEQDVGVLKLADLVVGVSHEVGRQIAAVELHAFDDVDGRLGLLALLDRDHAVFANFEKGLGEHVADRWVVVASNRGNLHQFFLVLFIDRRGHRQHGLRDRFDRLVDATRESHRVGPRRDHLDALAKNRLGEDGGRGGAIAGHVVGLAGGFLDELGAEVLVRILKVDVLGHGHAVLGDLRRAPALVEDSVAAAGAERALYGTGEFGHAGEQRLTGLVVEHHLFGHGRLLSTM